MDTRQPAHERFADDPCDLHRTDFGRQAVGNAEGLRMRLCKRDGRPRGVGRRNQTPAEIGSPAPDRVSAQ